MIFSILAEGKVNTLPSISNIKIIGSDGKEGGYCYMDGAVRETLCSSCSHRNVCAHKDNYLNMVKSLQGMFYKFPKDEIDFMYLKDPDCKLYSKESRTPRQFT